MTSTSEYNAQLTGQDRPEAAGQGFAGPADSAQGISNLQSSLDRISGEVDNLASTLGSGGSANRQAASQAGLGGSFQPHQSSPLAQQPIVDSSATRATHVGVASDPAGTSASTGTNPFEPNYHSSTSTGSTVGSQSGLGGNQSLTDLASDKLGLKGSDYDPSKLTSNTFNSGTSFSSSSNTGLSSTSNTSSGIDIGGAQTSATGGSTPGGVVKSQDHVENLVSAIGGIILNAPIAAAEILHGHGKKGAEIVQQKANEQGLTGVAQQVQGSLSNVAQLASDKIQQQRGPDAPPIADTISAYASSAAAQAQQLAASVSQQASGLVSRAGNSASATAQNTATSIDRNTPNSSDLPSSHTLAETVQGYASSATASITGLASSVAHSAQNLTARAGLTNPPAAVESSPAVHPEERHFATSESDAPRATLAEGEQKTNLSRSEVPSAAGADLSSGLSLPSASGLSSADSYSAGAASSIGYPASSLSTEQVQPGSSQYGQGRIGETNI